MALDETVVLKVNDQTVFSLTDTTRLTGNKGAVDPGSVSEYAIEPKEIRVAYNEPRSLVVTAYSHPPHSPLQLNRDRLKLYVNDVLRFNGLVKALTEDDTARGHQITYTAYDALDDANAIAYLDPNSNLPVFYKPLDVLTVWTDTAVTEVRYPTIRDCISKVFTDMATTMTANSIPTTYTGPIPNISAGAWYTTNKSIGALISALVDPFQNCRYLIDPTNNKWVFYDLQSLTLYDFDITVLPTPNYNTGIDIRDRYSAVLLIGEDPDTSYVATKTVELTAAWNASGEASWSWKDFLLTSSATFNDSTKGAKELHQATEKKSIAGGSGDVYRLWSFASALVSIWPTQDLVQIFQLMDAGTANEHFIQVEVEGEIDFANKRLMTKYPILGGGDLSKRQFRNPMIPGKAKQGRLFMRYPVFAGSGSVFGVRVPAADYSGQAFSWYGLEREYVELVEGKTNFLEISLRAMMDHDNLSHIAVNQSLPHLGALPVEVWNLGIAVNIKKGHGTTGYETLQAPLIGFTHTFTGGGSTTFEFTTARTRQREAV